MKCPNCGSRRNEMMKKEERLWLDWRRRRCLNCKHRFSTYERISRKDRPETPEPLRPSRRKKNPYGIDWRSRASVIRFRDGNTCQICGRSSPQGTKFHVHHIVPLVVSRCNHPDNLVTLCPECHSRQGPADAAARRGDFLEFKRLLNQIGWPFLRVDRALRAWGNTPDK